MTTNPGINPKQIAVTKIYPGNYSNVLRYWHVINSFQFQDPNGRDVTYQNQPIGGPVGVIYKPGWVAQQAVGFVDLSYQPGGENQMSYYLKPWGTGAAGAFAPFTEGPVIIPSPDFHKDVRPDLNDEIVVPSGAYVYRVSLRLSGGNISNSGIAGASTTAAIGFGPGVGTQVSTEFSPSGAFAVILGSGTEIINGETAASNAWDSSTMQAVTGTTQYKLYSVNPDSADGTYTGSGVILGSGNYDPRAGVQYLAGDDKALGICEVCWMVSDEPPERDDLALQPDGITESSVYTSTVPRG